MALTKLLGSGGICQNLGRFLPPNPPSPLRNLLFVFILYDFFSPCCHLVSVSAYTKCFAKVRVLYSGLILSFTIILQFAFVFLQNVHFCSNSESVQYYLGFVQLFLSCISRSWHVCSSIYLWYSLYVFWFDSLSPWYCQGVTISID